MRIDVALLPELVADTDSVFAVVDVLRASSAIVTLLERGVPAASVEEARELWERLPDYLLCGERDSLPPPGFDHGIRLWRIAALFARDAFLARRRDLRAALASAGHGAELIAGGFAADVEYCARLDVSSIVPLFQRDAGGLLTLRLV